MLVGGGVDYALLSADGTGEVGRGDVVWHPRGDLDCSPSATPFGTAGTDLEITVESAFPVAGTATGTRRGARSSTAIGPAAAWRGTGGDLAGPRGRPRRVPPGRRPGTRRARPVTSVAVGLQSRRPAPAPDSSHSASLRDLRESGERLTVVTNAGQLLCSRRSPPEGWRGRSRTRRRHRITGQRGANRGRGDASGLSAGITIVAAILARDGTRLRSRLPPRRRDPGRSGRRGGGVVLGFYAVYVRFIKQ